MWEYTITFSKALPCRGSILAKTKTEATELLKARHRKSQNASEIISIEVHSKNNNLNLKKR